MKKSFAMVIRRRMHFVFFFFLLAYGALLGRLFLLQIVHHQDYLRLAAKQHELVKEIYPERGIIFAQDKNHALIPLALNRTYTTVAVSPRDVKDREAVARALQESLFKKLDEIAYTLENIIREHRVCEAVGALLPPARPFANLSWLAHNRLMLIYAMLAHAYFKEKLGYKTIDECKADKIPKALPPQLAVPLWQLHKITGIEPSLSYMLYGPGANHYKKDPEGPWEVENLLLLHSFTGGGDESWFVRTHLGMEAKSAPAIPDLTTAHVLSLRHDRHQRFIAQAITNRLFKAARVGDDVVAILKRMREHCDYRTYFQKVRLFYAFPSLVIFDGVPELAGKALSILGETGGMAALKHTLLACAGIDHDDDPYFPAMRKHMPRPFRNFILHIKKTTRIREFVLAELERGNQEPAKAYNAFLQSFILNWDMVHDGLVKDFIVRFGDGHGTGGTPIPWLQGLYEKRKTFLVAL